jgi:hypothetical protein
VLLVLLVLVRLVLPRVQLSWLLRVRVLLLRHY